MHNGKQLHFGRVFYNAIFTYALLLSFAFSSVFVNAEDIGRSSSVLNKQIPAAKDAFPLLSFERKSEIQSFDIYGWSKDSHYWAYSTAGDYGQGAMYFFQHQYYIYDINNIAKPVVISFSLKEDDEGYELLTEDDINNKKLKFTVTSNDEMVHRNIGNSFGIEVFKSKHIFNLKKDVYWPELTPNKQIEFEIDGKRYFVNLILEKEENQDVNDFNTNTIILRSSKGNMHNKVVLKKLKKKYFNASIVYASISPDHKYIAILIAGASSGYEGHVTYEYSCVFERLSSL